MTDDRKVIRFAEKNGIAVLDMKDLLTLLAIRQVLGYSEMISLIREIEVKDNTCIKYKDKILARYPRIDV